MNYLFLLPFFVFLVSCGSVQKRIALSFDDVPAQDSAFLKENERSLLIRTKLKRLQVPPVVFYINGQKLNKRNLDLISDYDLEGHIIANHGHQHLDANKVDVKTFIRNIQKNHELLKGFSNYRSWFRYPYLRNGDSRKKRDLIKKGLEKIKYKHGYVTVDNYDWKINELVLKYAKSKKKIPMREVRQLYLNHIWESIEFYDGIAEKSLGRDDLSHILLLHENDLAAFFIDDLVRLIRSKGWEIISIEQAYKDEFADYETRSLVSNQGKVVASALDNGYKGPITQKSESSAYWEKIFKSFSSKDKN